MTSKWPLNDLKWPIVTWKHNFLTKSHFGACNMSFHRFLWTPSRLRISDLSFESLNDLQMTSKWPQVTHKDLKTTFLPNLTLGHVLYFHRFFSTLSRLRLSALSFKSSNDLQFTSSDPYWTPNITFVLNLTFGHVIFFSIGFSFYFLHPEVNLGTLEVI